MRLKQNINTVNLRISERPIPQINGSDFRKTGYLAIHYPTMLLSQLNAELPPRTTTPAINVILIIWVPLGFPKIMNMPEIAKPIGTKSPASLFVFVVKLVAIDSKSLAITGWLINK